MIRQAAVPLVGDTIVGFTIFGLTPSASMPDYSANQHSLLSPVQRAAVARLLRYLAAHADEYSQRDARKALAHWDRSSE